MCTNEVRQEDANLFRGSSSILQCMRQLNDPQELDYRFLHKFLFWKYISGATESMQSHSTGIRNLNAEAYKQISVPLPQLREQQRIVATLNEAFAGLATAAANTEKTLSDSNASLRCSL